ncbi:Ig-like domain-containing protein, partial [Pseudomonas sp. PDM22]|uniref:Ig-like domain-containing protein n=1 Tax=Pseudomonas sp. PDM22 TaxID=2769287 RepID=UPI00177F0C05
IHVFDGGKELGSTTAKDDGTWSFEVPADKALAEGEHDFTVKAEDPAGNISDASVPYPIVIDITPPDSKTTQLTIDTVAGDDIVDKTEAAGNVTISGKVTGEFQAGDMVSFKLDGTTYSAKVASDGKWSVDVPGSKLVADTAHKIDATLVAHDAAGNAGSISASHSYQVEAANVVSITSMSKDSSTDVAHATDFITADGTAGRGVYGKLEDALAANQKVQVSFDNGATWKDALTTGLNWVAVDSGTHAGNWTIQARVMEGGNVVGDVAKQDVTFLAAQGGAPTITSIPDAVGDYTTAKAADGSDVTVSLSGTLAKAGDTLHIIWGDTTYDQVLTTADIAAGTATAKVPAQQTTSQSATYDIVVKAQIVTQEGQISALSSDFKVQGTGYWATASDGLQRYPSGNTYVGDGFTVTSNTTLTHVDPFTYSPNGGLDIPSETYGYLQFNFSGQVNSASFGLGGLQNDAGGARVVVYGTSGQVLYTTYAQGSYSVGSFSYSSASMIGSIRVYGDGVGTSVTVNSLTFSQFVHGASPTAATGQKVIDHTWETYFDDNTASSSSDVISMTIDPTAYFQQDSAHVHGGNHLDTLKLTGAGQVLDLRGLTGDSGEGKISSIEKFDITGTGNNTLKISLNEVLHLGETNMFRTDGKVQVMVDGNAGDVVELYGLEGHGATTGAWQSAGTTTIGGVVYQVYTFSTLDAEMLVKQGVTTNLMVGGQGGGTGTIDSMSKDSGLATDFVTEDGSAGRLVTGTLSGSLASGNYLEVSLDNGSSWSKVMAVSGSQWAFVDKTAHVSDWSVQLRVNDGIGDTSSLASQQVTLAPVAKAPTITSIPKAGGVLTSTEASGGVDMVVSLANTGAKAGDIVHVQWGIALFDQTLTAADITAGQATVKVTSAVAYTEQGVAYDFDVTASIVSNGVAGASSSPFHIIGGGFATKAVSDTLSVAATNVVDNSYAGSGVTVTTDGGLMTKVTTPATGVGLLGHYAGLLVSQAGSANALFTLDQPGTKFAVTLSGLDNTKGGATVIVYGVNGDEIYREVVTGAGSYNSKAFSYTAAEGVDVGSFKVVSTCDGLYVSTFSETQAFHVADSRTFAVDGVTDSYYGSLGDDTVLLKYAASTYLSNTGNTGIHGGDGVDTLKVENYNQTLDLTLATSKGKVTSMEIIDLTSTNASYGNTLKLSVQDVLENGQTDLFHSTTNHTVQMMVKGDAKSVVNLDDLLGANGPDYGDWSNSGTVNVAGTNYNVYQHSGLDAELLVQQAVKVNLV